MLDYTILGIIQGIFEWLPISSEGAVALASQFFSQGVRPIDVALFLHLGTLLAVLIYFREDWQKVILFQDLRLLRFLVIATVISLIVGFPLYQVLRDSLVGSGLLLIMGFGLLLTAFFHKKRQFFNFSLEKLAVLAGVLQGLSVIPGLSRSGSTIFSLSLGNLKPVEILKFSYMMSLPVVLTSSIYLFLGDPSFILESWPALVASFLVGLLSLRFLITLSLRINFFSFALFFAILCFVGAGIQFIL
jgi:undecaprenyl-diphosphatase